jgi:hypothetical protein
MLGASEGAAPTSFWVVAFLLLFWNLVGMMFYYLQVTMPPEAVAANFNEAQQAFLNEMPRWATSAYAIAVTAGVLASALLLLRKAIAAILFIVSFAGVLIQDFQAFVLSDGLGTWGASGLYLPSVVIVMSIFAIGFSYAARKRGWLT